MVPLSLIITVPPFLVWDWTDIKFNLSPSESTSFFRIAPIAGLFCSVQSSHGSQKVNGLAD